MVEMIFFRLYQNIPNPQSELVWKTPFELLVAVVLSAQATDKSVNKIMPHLMQYAPTPQAMSSININILENLISTINLYHTKAKHLIDLSKILVQKFNNIVPDNMENLLLLPGVGRKTANVVLNVVFNKPTIPVDTHVRRVSIRLNLSNHTKPYEIEKDLMECVPKKYLYNAHHYLLLHGRYTCTAKKPHCSICFLKDLCQFYAISLNNC